MTVSLSPAHGEDPRAAVESDMRSAAVAWLSGPAPPWLPNRIPVPPSIMSDGFRPPLWVSRCQGVILDSLRLKPQAHHAFLIPL